MIKIKESMLNPFIKFYNQLDIQSNYDGKNFENMFMTSFLQMISERLCPITPVFIQNGWMEVDTPSDLKFHSFLK